MMVKRNKELELEVLRHMKRMQEKTSKKEETPAEPEKKEQAETEDELSKAMQLSKESFAHEVRVEFLFLWLCVHSISAFRMKTRL